MAFFDVDDLESMEFEADGALSDRLVVLGMEVDADGVDEPSPLPGLAPFWIGSAFLFFRGAILSKRMLIFELWTLGSEKMKEVKRRRKKTDCDGTGRFHLTDVQKCEVAKWSREPLCCHQYLVRNDQAMHSELRVDKIRACLFRSSN